ncbi:ribbon-helix-helix protein, CopG family [Microbacterium sp. C7(2022)]|uniref:ribbon-helix-helix protein, CopG family n=1 Tax=Microbacterium sp. C7(2022) TaxID=2992759 RepID=UPI00237A571B|nr:ribbon-helix-helix protein, CopG family [Microbacterium sp. C7(2022)]MDE0547667.1 ribbon-helix-helix protein, CopG family [Microbacterium sp. C7(2022)]
MPLSGETAYDVGCGRGRGGVGDLGGDTQDARARWDRDVEVLKRRGLGRPGRGAEPAQVVALRLTADELAALDARAEREHKTRSELIREAIAAHAA